MGIFRDEKQTDEHGKVKKVSVFEAGFIKHYRPVGSFLLTGFAAYAAWKGIEIPESVHAILALLFPGWMASRHVDKNHRVQAAKEIAIERKRAQLVDRIGSVVASDRQAMGFMSMDEGGYDRHTQDHARARAGKPLEVPYPTRHARERAPQAAATPPKKAKPELKFKDEAMDLIADDAAGDLNDMLPDDVPTITEEAGVKPLQEPIYFTQIPRA